MGKFNWVHLMVSFVERWSFIRSVSYRRFHCTWLWLHHLLLTYFNLGSQCTCTLTLSIEASKATTCFLDFSITCWCYRVQNQLVHTLYIILWSHKDITQLYTALHSITQYYTALHYIALHSITLHSTLHSIAQHYTTLHYTTLHSITQHYITRTALHSITQHYTALHIATCFLNLLLWLFKFKKWLFYLFCKLHNYNTASEVNSLDPWNEATPVSWPLCFTVQKSIPNHLLIRMLWQVPRVARLILANPSLKRDHGHSGVAYKVLLQNHGTNLFSKFRVSLWAMPQFSLQGLPRLPYCADV